MEQNPTLQLLLDTLMRQMKLKMWTIFEEQSGSTLVKLRFSKMGDNEETVLTNTQQKFVRSSDKRLHRDAERARLHNQKKPPIVNNDGTETTERPVSDEIPGGTSENVNVPDVQKIDSPSLEENRPEGSVSNPLEENTVTLTPNRKSSKVIPLRTTPYSMHAEKKIHDSNPMKKDGIPPEYKTFPKLNSRDRKIRYSPRLPVACVACKKDWNTISEEGIVMGVCTDFCRPKHEGWVCARCHSESVHKECVMSILVSNCY